MNSLDHFLRNPKVGYPAQTEFWKRNNPELEIPSDEQVRATLAEFHHEQINVLAGPKLVLTPRRDIRDVMVKQSDELYQWGETQVGISVWSGKALDRRTFRGSSAWELGIVEAAPVPALHPVDDVNEILGERYEHFKSFCRIRGIQPMTQQMYLPLAVQAKQAGLPIDDLTTDKVWAVLAERDATRIAGAYYFAMAGAIALFEENPADHYEGARFRAQLSAPIKS